MVINRCAGHLFVDYERSKIADIAPVLEGVSDNWQLACLRWLYISVSASLKPCPGQLLEGGNIKAKKTFRLNPSSHMAMSSDASP